MSRVKKSGFSFHFQSHQHHYLFIGLDGCPNRGLARPFNFFGIYDQFDLDFLSRQVHLQTSLPLQHIFTFGHYPIGTTVNTRSSQGETLTSLMTDVSTYMCGHLHRFKVWDVPHMYYTHSSGLLELELADLKTHGAYRLNLVDQGHFVFRDLDLPKLPPIYLPWTLNYSYATLNPIQPPPVLLISSPIDVRFYLFHREPPLSSHWPLDQSIRVFLFTQLLPPFQWNNSIECFPSKNNTFSSSLPFPLFSSSSSSSSFFISLPEPTSHPPSLYITQWPDIMATLVNTSNCPCFRLHIKVLHVETQLQDFQQVYVDLQWRNLGLSSTLTSPTSNPWNLGTLILAMDFNKVFKIFFFLEYGLVFLVLFIPKLMLAINEWRWKWNASPSNSNQNFPHTSHHLKSKFTLLNPPSLPQSRDGEASVTERLSFSPFHHHFLLSFHRRDANIGWFDSLWLRFVVVTTIHRKEWYLMYFLALISLVVPYFKGELIEGHIGGFYLMGAHFGSRYLPLLDTWFFICNVWGTLYVPFIFWFSGWHLNALKTSSPSLNSSRGEGKVTLSQWIHWWWIAFSLMGHLYQLNSMVQNYGENLWWSYLTFTYFMIGIALAQSGLKLCYWSWLRFYKCFISTSVNKDQAKLKSN
ncbi:hypothetical protein HMI55_006135 [Coelomomyces lativittatus]|nr:hypothetical protein HMI56_002835 [Coelomomyces lativittatus]KAJ1512708.1 hypothetical protein HMI55_006135 [Coelomomyces lativittatus]